MEVREWKEKEWGAREKMENERKKKMKRRRGREEEEEVFFITIEK